MGLDVSHDAWNGPYSSFGEWRTSLARYFGIDLDQMKGFAVSPGAVVDVRLKTECIQDRKDRKRRSYPPMSWDLVEDPIKVLLHRSHCDGRITLAELQPLVRRLQAALLLMVAENEEEWLVDRTRRFLNGCCSAIEAGEDLEFH